MYACAWLVDKDNLLFLSIAKNLNKLDIVLDKDLGIYGYTSTMYVRTWHL